MGIFIKTKYQILIILFITFLAYSNIFNNQFLWDDHDIIRWAQNKEFSDIPNIFGGDVPSVNEIYFRPFVSIFYFRLSLEILNRNKMRQREK